MDEGTFGEEQIELAVESRPRLGNGRRVAQHTHGSLYLSQVAARYDCWRLVVDAHLYTTASETVSCSGSHYR